MTTEEKIHIAASFDSEKIKMIRELLADAIKPYSELLQRAVKLNHEDMGFDVDVWELLNNNTIEN